MSSSPTMRTASSKMPMLTTVSRPNSRNISMRLLILPSLLLVACLLTSCASSGSWQTAEVKTSLKCPAAGADLATEVKRKPAIKGETAVEIAGDLVRQVRRKNAALKRALAAYQACRET